jgi:hypothetical protein
LPDWLDEPQFPEGCGKHDHGREKEKVEVVAQSTVFFSSIQHIVSPTRAYLIGCKQR